jgi:hypothetical protein
MKRFLALVSCLCCVHCGSAYFYPICSATNDKSCTDYFSLPSFQMTFSKKPPQEGSVNEVEDNVQPITQAVTEVLDNTFATAVTYYKENLNPFVFNMYKTVVPYLPTFKGEYLRLVQYFPVLKEEEKAKADTKLYFLFIATSLAIYLVLYIYFTKKLYLYYQANLRQQYLNNVKRIFKTKE